MPEPPLQAEQFGRRYQRNRPWAVRDLSVTVPAGSLTALVGPNGSGKSTLIRACLGFEVPDAGRVLVYGADPQRSRAEAVGAIGYIPQSASLYRRLTIRDHLTMAAAARASFDRVSAAQRIESVGLSEKRKVGDLSGGEQAQVALAIALSIHAPLLLLDEPLASLDPLARRDFLAAMTIEVRQRRATAIISSHLISDVEHICDWLVILAEGRLALASSVATAKNTFRIVADTRLDQDAVVGAFQGPTGEQLALVRSDQAGRPATLEEVVLGHLAASRTHRAESRP